MRPRALTKEEVVAHLHEFELGEVPFRVWNSTFGLHPSKRPGEGMEFREYRAYEQGEDISNLDVEASLRIGEKVVRENLTEEKIRNLVFLDDSCSMRYYGKWPMALWIAGSLLVSASRRRDPVRILTLGGDGLRFSSAPLYTREEVVGAVLALWDEKIPEPGPQADELSGYARTVSEILSSSGNRLIFISDFEFSDVKVSFSRRGIASLNNKEMLARFIQNAERDGENDLLFFGIAPCWEDLLSLRGFFPLQDAENRSGALVRFTKRSAREFVLQQRQAEKTWSDTAGSLNVPLIWIHAGDRVLLNLEKHFAK